MKRDVLKIALVVSLVFNAAVIGAFAYGFARRPAPPEDCPAPEQFASHGGRIARHIGVPRERTMRFVRVMADSSRETAGIRSALRSARGELIVLIEAGEPDESAIMAKVDEVSRLQGDLEKRVVARLLDARTVLTHEERARFMHLIRHRCISEDSAGRFTQPVGGRKERGVR